LLDKGFFKNTHIGKFDFDLSYIYFMEKHTLLHKWIALSNPEAEDFSEITAYVKISISVTASGDEQYEITETNEAEDNNVLMPPQLNPSYYQLKFRFF